MGIVMNPLPKDQGKQFAISIINTLKNRNFEDFYNHMAFGENTWLELKSHFLPKEGTNDPKNDVLWTIVKAIIALANSCGGMILIGWSEKENSPIKLTDGEGNCLSDTTKDMFLRKFQSKINKTDFKTSDGLFIPSTDITNLYNADVISDSKNNYFIILFIKKNPNKIFVKKIYKKEEYIFFFGREIANCGITFSSSNPKEIENFYNRCDEKITDYFEMEYRKFSDLLAEQNDISQIKTNIPIYSQQYIERKCLIKHILSKLANKSSNKIIKIRGFGAIGKTSLAKKIANVCITKELKTYNIENYQINFDLIVLVTSKNQYIDTECTYINTEEINLDFILNDILRTADLPMVHDNIHDKFNQINEYLNNHRMLLIVDNFDTIIDKSIISILLDNIHLPNKIIITSRDDININDSIEYTVKPLTKKESEILINNLLNKKYLKKETVDLIVQNTNGMPQEIEMICPMLNKGVIPSAKDFFSSDLYDNTKEKLYNYIFRTSLKKLSEDAISLLKIMTYIPCALPLDFLYFLLKNKAAPIMELESLSLITVDSQNNLIAISNFTRKIIIKQFSKIHNYQNEKDKIQVFIAKKVLAFIFQKAGDTDWASAEIISSYRNYEELYTWSIDKVIYYKISERHIPSIIKCAQVASYTGQSHYSLKYFLIPTINANKNSHIAFRLYRQIAWDYYLIRNYKKTAEYCAAIIKLYSSNKNTNSRNLILAVADAYRMFGLIQKQNENLEEAVKYFDISEKYITPYLEYTRFKQLYAALCSNKSTCLTNPREERFFLEKAINITCSIEENNEPFLTLVKQKLACLNIKEGKLDGVKEQLDESRRIDEEMGRKRGIAYYYLYIARYYEKTGDISTAQKHILKARRCFANINNELKVAKDYRRIFALDQCVNGQ